MQHRVGVDAVVTGIASAGCSHPSLVVALLLQEVIEIERHHEGFASEECLGYLTVPDKLVRVHRWVIISPSAMLTQVGAELETQGETNEHLTTIAELPGVEVGIGLQFVAGMLIVHITIQRHFEPRIAEADVESLIQVCGTGGVLLGIRLLLCHITHIVL